jgi:hypothetical protein
VLAGCGGGGKQAATTTTTTAAPKPPPVADAMRTFLRSRPQFAGTVKTLYEGPEWGVVQAKRGTRVLAVAFHYTGGRWRPDTSHKVTIEILGPNPGSTQPVEPQVAVVIKSRAPLRETALWVDGKELLEKGGGKPTNAQIYGAPDRRLARGLHVAVGFGHSDVHATAVAWTFRVGAV